jgi:hypothetical protein
MPHSVARVIPLFCSDNCVWQPSRYTAAERMKSPTVLIADDQPHILVVGK